MSLLPASIKRIGSRTTEKRWRHLFSIISQWELSFAMETRVLIQSAPKPSAAFHPSQWCYTYNLIKIGHLVSEIFKFERADAEQQRTDDGPLVYCKLTLWAFSSGELKNWKKKTLKEYQCPSLHMDGGCPGWSESLLFAGHTSFCRQFWANSVDPDQTAHRTDRSG